MKVHSKLLLAILTLLLVPTPMASQTVSSGQEAALLEIAQTRVVGDSESYSIRIYADGRVISEGGYTKRLKNGRRRKIFSREETRLEPEEITELLSWVERPDFLNAQPEYTVKLVQDSPDWITLLYRNQGREKKIKVYNFGRATEVEKANLPPSLVKLLEWIYESPF